MTNIAMSTLVLNSSSAKKILKSLFIDLYFHFKLLGTLTSVRVQIFINYYIINQYVVNLVPIGVLVFGTMGFSICIRTCKSTEVRTAKDKRKITPKSPHTNL